MRVLQYYGCFWQAATFSSVACHKLRCVRLPAAAAAAAQIEISANFKVHYSVAGAFAT